MELSYEAKKKNTKLVECVLLPTHRNRIEHIGVDECDTSRTQYGKSRSLFIIYFENGSLNKI